MDRKSPWPRPRQWSSSWPSPAPTCLHSPWRRCLASPYVEITLSFHCHWLQPISHAEAPDHWPAEAVPAEPSHWAQSSPPSAEWPPPTTRHSPPRWSTPWPACPGTMSTPSSPRHRTATQFTPDWCSRARGRDTNWSSSPVSSTGQLHALERLPRSIDGPRVCCPDPHKHVLKCSRCRWPGPHTGARGWSAGCARPPPPSPGTGAPASCRPPTYVSVRAVSCLLWLYLNSATKNILQQKYWVLFLEYWVLSVEFILKYGHPK